MAWLIKLDIWQLILVYFCFHEFVLIVCENCKKVCEFDETPYNHLLSQVDEKFNNQK
jgi:hypothetical protein